MLGISIVDAILVGSITIASAVLFKLKPEFFGDYKTAFKGDSLSQYHYWLVLGIRIVLACVIVGLSAINYAGFICSVIPLASIVYILVKRPYNLLYNNIRAVVNEAIILIVLCIYGYYQAFVDPAKQEPLATTVMPIIEIVLLLACIVVNSVFMVKYWYDKRKLAKEAAKKGEADKSTKLEPDLDAQFKE